MAARADSSQFYISSLEAGRRNPTVQTVYDLGQALGVDWLDLLRPSGEKVEPKP